MNIHYTFKRKTPLSSGDRGKKKYPLLGAQSVESTFLDLEINIKLFSKKSLINYIPICINTILDLDIYSIPLDVVAFFI